VDTEQMSSLQRNLLRRAESRKNKITPPKQIHLSPREAEIREVAETVAGANGWGIEYSLRQVRRVVGDHIDPFYAITQLAYGYGGKDKPAAAQYGEVNRHERRRARALGRRDKGHD
jgi:hypothetical protein